MKRKFERTLDDGGVDNFYYIYENKKRNLSCNFKLSASTCNTNTNATSETDTGYFSLEAPRNGGAAFSLFNMCLKFIARHIDMVESLHGFPEIVAERLFEQCVQQSIFCLSPTNNTKQIDLNLKLFANVYTDVFITGLNLSNRTPKQVNFLLPYVAASNLVELNLSNCRLNDLFGGESTLMDVLKNSAHSLRLLDLSCNDLDDGFLRKFTLPCRLNHVNMIKLEYVNLSANLRLDVNVLKYFSKFSCLNEVMLSLRSRSTNSSFEQFKLCKCPIEKRTVLNRGWIERVNLDCLVDENERVSSVEGNFLFCLIIL